MKHWAANYIDLPYKSKGRTASGVDCWGLLYLIYRQELNIELPSYLDGYDNAADAAQVSALIEKRKLDQWREITGKPQEFDAVLIRMKGHPMHVGICIDSRRFIHVLETTNVALEKLEAGCWRHRIIGIYRHESRL